MGTEHSGHRKRGIQASRARLTQALTEAGLKTQSALAERIADIEGLDAAPRDMVNRAFRERPVEMVSLERIARALGAETHTLLKTAAENGAASGESAPGKAAVPEQPAAPLPRSRIATALAASVLFCAAVGLAAWWIAPALDDALPSRGSEDPATLSLGDLHIVVVPLGGDDELLLTTALRQALAEHANVATHTATAIAAGAGINEIATRLRADIVLDGELVSVGRLSGARLFAYAAGVRQQIWAESFPTPATASVVAGVADRMVAALQRANRTESGSFPTPHFPLAPAQDDYLAGERLLDRPANELNLKRAESRFDAALRQDPDYALAHAGLCQTLLTEHWMFEEDRMLQDASRACGRALQLDPDSAAVASAHAHFLARTGRLTEAIELYESTIERHPLNASPREGLAARLLDAYRQSGDPRELDRARSAALAAAATDPYVWKPLWYVAATEWFAGDNEGAIRASEAALERDENEYVLANLGTFYMCRGDFEKARSAYLRAREIAPHSYIGDEFLGSVYYFLGEYAESIRLRRKAISAIGDGEPEMHEMWGQLGDAYRLNDETANAIDAYRRAAEIAERDYLRGTAPAADRAARAYYYTVLGTLDADLIPRSIEQNISNELDTISADLVEASAHRRMAQIWVLRGEPTKAAAALEQATATCPGYGRLPEFSALTTSAGR